MSQLQELIAQQKSVQAELKACAKAELQVLELRMKELLDILDGELPTEKKVSMPKYRDPETGKTWTGKGKRPAWFDSERLGDFLI